MANSSHPHLAPSQQSISQGTPHGCTVSKTRSGVPMTVIHPQCNLPTPTTSRPKRESGKYSTHGYAGAISPRASPRQVPKRVVPSMRGTQDVFEWVSKVEPWMPASEDQKYDSPTSWIFCSKDKAPTPRDHIGMHGEPRFAVSEFDPALKFAGVVNELTRTAVERFRSEQVNPSRKRSISPSPERCRKRSRLASCQDSESAGSESEFAESDIVLVEHLVETASPIWPCPFFVRDRESYLSCWTRHCLLSVDDVQEHLLSTHLEPIHCSVCYTTFSTVGLRDTHMRSQECLYRLPVVFDGLRDSQVRELERQGKADGKAPGLQAIQWVKMWCIVFSCTQLPPLPFSFSQQELVVYEFHRFWERHGENIIEGVLVKQRLQENNIGDEEGSLQALHSLVADHAVDCLLLTQDNTDT